MKSLNNALTIKCLRHLLMTLAKKELSKTLSRSHVSLIWQQRAPNLLINSTKTILRCFTLTQVPKAIQPSVYYATRQEYPRSKVWPLKDANWAIIKRLKFTTQRILSLRSWGRCRLLSRKPMQSRPNRIKITQEIWEISRGKPWMIVNYWKSALIFAKS